MYLAFQATYRISHYDLRLVVVLSVSLYLALFSFVGVQNGDQSFLNHHRPLNNPRNTRSRPETHVDANLYTSRSYYIHAHVYARVRTCTQTHSFLIHWCSIVIFGAYHRWSMADRRTFFGVLESINASDWGDVLAVNKSTVTGFFIFNSRLSRATAALACKPTRVYIYNIYTHTHTHVCILNTASLTSSIHSHAPSGWLFFTIYWQRPDERRLICDYGSTANILYITIICIWL